MTIEEMVLAMARDEWAVADALLEEIGPVASAATIRACARYLADHGVEYSMARLKRLHTAAAAFPPGDRPEWLLPAHAFAAGTPEVLAMAVAVQAEKGFDPPPRVAEITSVRQAMEYRQRKSKS